MLPHSKSRAYHQELMNRYVAETKRGRRAHGLDHLARLAEATRDGLASVTKSLRRTFHQRPV